MSNPAPTQTSPTLSDDDRDAAIDRLYDVALDPERYEALLDIWEEAVSPLRAEADLASPHILNDPQITGHFRRASRFLDRLKLDNAQTELQDILAPFGKVTAFVMDATCKILAINTAAQSCFDLSTGGKLSELPVHDGDLDAVTRTVRQLLQNAQETSAVLRVRSQAKGNFIVIRLQVLQPEGKAPVIITVLSEVGWPEGFTDILRRAFDLSVAEAQVVRALVECCSLAEIAEQRGRSLATIRAQIKSILAKTETRSQVELVRLALSVMDMAGLTLDTEVNPRLVSRGYDQLQPRPFHSLTTPDGRRLDYLTLGDPAGKPVLFLPLDYGLIRWPASAEAEALRRGWRIIVPVRAGYGQSDHLPKKADFDQALVQDTMQVLQAEAVDSCPILSLGNDSYFAVLLANHAPEVFTALIACAGTLPMLNRDQYERMEKWHRFILAGAKYTPHLLPFMVKAGFLLARKIGKRGFVHAVYGQCPADVETFEDPEVFEAMVTGSEVALSDRHSAHDAFSRTLLGGMHSDWSGQANALRGRIPVLFMNGTQDPQVPVETLHDFQRDFDWIDYEIFNDAGQLIFFRHWPTVFDRLQPFLAE